jgi:hypothetical protein
VSSKPGALQVVGVEQRTAWRCICTLWGTTPTESLSATVASSRRPGVSATRRRRLLVVVRSTSRPEVVDDFCFDSLRRLLAAASSRAEQADCGLSDDCPIAEREACTLAIPRSETSPFS